MQFAESFDFLFGVTVINEKSNLFKDSSTCTKNTVLLSNFLLGQENRRNGSAVAVGLQPTASPSRGYFPCFQWVVNPLGLKTEGCKPSVTVHKGQYYVYKKY